MRFRVFCLCAMTCFLFACSGDSEGGDKENLTLSPPDQPGKPDPASVPGSPYFIHLSDVHLNSFDSTASYGEDTGTDLWQSTKEKLKAVMNSNPTPQFLVYTGDLPAHYACSSTCYIEPDKREEHNENLRVILEDMRELVEENGLPLLYMPGNNDALAGDYYSFADEEAATPFSLVSDPELPYPALHANTPCGEVPCMVSDPHPSMGYYAARPVEGLRVIALNSIILGHRYLEVDGISQLEAGNTQMVWLGEQLAAAREAGDKVYLTMHIPPGKDAYAVSHKKDTTWMWAHLPSQEDSWLDQFLQYTTDFQSEIAGILYGHTHMDELRRLYDPSGESITEVAISAPGITPQHYNNPGFKLVWYDGQSKELVDFETHYTDPGASEWKSYRFSEQFSCPAGSNLFDCLSNQDSATVNADMDKIFTVMHDAPSYATGSGIEVRAGQ